MSRDAAGAMSSGGSSSCSSSCVCGMAWHGMAWHGMAWHAARHAHGSRCTRHDTRLRLCILHDARGIAHGTVCRAMPCHAMPTCAGHHGVLIHMRATAPWPQGEQLKFLLLPKDPLDEKNIMLEVRCSWMGLYRLLLLQFFRG